MHMASDCQIRPDLRGMVECAEESREHLWIANVTFRIPPVDALRMNDDGSVTDPPLAFTNDSMVAVTMGCYICEESFTEELRSNPCKGDPNS